MGHNADYIWIAYSITLVVLILQFIFSLRRKHACHSKKEIN